MTHLTQAPFNLRNGQVTTQLNQEEFNGSFSTISNR
jgi:hypothetical protein